MIVFRVLVCGGRAYADRGRLEAELEALRQREGFLCIVEGGAQGADALARQWAIESGSDLHQYEANWKRDGKAAGPIRNQRMLDESKPDMVLAFPGGKGTADMIRRARKAGVPVVEVAA